VTKARRSGYVDHVKSMLAGREVAMRTMILISVIIGGLAVVGAAPAQAVGTRYPYCMQGSSSPGLSNCTFTSLAQCRATASGRFLTCIANPFYKGRRR
jgi:hypothetical protein